MEQEHRLKELDGLRGLACLLVLLDHCVVGPVPLHWIPGLGRLSGWLIGGVDLFFVLSGFLISGILLDNKGAGNYFMVFWIRRVGRIMPVYYLLMLSFFAMLLVKQQFPASWLDVYLFRDAMPLWTYPVFVQNFAQAADGGTGGARWVASTWSLAVEEQFYLLLPPLAYMLSRRSLAAVAVACVCAACLVRATLWSASGSWNTAYFLLPGRMDSLMFGLLSAVIVRRPPALRFVQRHRLFFDAGSVAAAVALTAAVFSPNGVTPSSRAEFVIWSLDFTVRAALFAYLIVRIFIVPENSPYRQLLSAKSLVGTGIISYALYMYHPAINGIVHGLVFQDEPRIVDAGHLSVAVLVIAISIVLAWLSTRYFEMPIRKLTHRFKYISRKGFARQI